MPAEEGAFIRIAAIGPRTLATPYGRVRLLNVSEGGCCFGSGLRFPVHPELKLELMWPDSSGCALELPGHIVWRADAEEGYRYGLQFDLTPQRRLSLIGRLNDLLLKLCPAQTKIHALYRKLSSEWLLPGQEEASS